MCISVPAAVISLVGYIDGQKLCMKREKLM